MSEPNIGFLCDCIGELCAKLGLEYSFITLANAIKEYIPFTYMCCSSMEISTGKYSILMESNKFGADIARQGHAYMREDGIVDVGNDTRIFIRNPQTIYCDPFHTPTDTVHASMISMELFHKDDSIYYIGLRAVPVGAFTVEHARIFSHLKEPIGRLVRELFINNADHAIASTAISSTMNEAQSRLSLCRGLSGVNQKVREVAPVKANVLILGETGVGKEVVAEAIHEASNRRTRSFVKVNCGAIPESLLEAELFGYERGAFTGAIQAHKGYFEQAQGGTIFLDEVGELSPSAQVRLLRVLETREVQRIGSPKRIVLDFRLISATNKDLPTLVREGTFRADLWYRLNAYTIHVPSLAQRREDIPVLLNYFCVACSMDMELESIPQTDPKLIRSLVMQDWPGNVRQLRNWVERALIYTHTMGSPTLMSPQEENLELPGARKSSLRGIGQDSPVTLEEMNRQYILWALNQCNGRLQGKGSISELLGIHPSTLRARMKKLGIPVKQARLAN